MVVLEKHYLDEIGVDCEGFHRWGFPVADESCESMDVDNVNFTYRGQNHESVSTLV